MHLSSSLRKQPYTKYSKEQQRMKMFTVIPRIRISNGDSQLNMPPGWVAFMKGQQEWSNHHGRTYLTQTQFTTFTTEQYGIINTRPLVCIDDDKNSTNATVPMHFFSLNPKIDTPNPIEDLSYDTQIANQRE